jgi:hypothetical protein|mmetsp:Transcript_40821/g.64727  ORF Transcript_40821/g.64727 Transcript_40821/m.64727 type:complete len:263 (+) Transcript_40821:60-848(+)
MCKYPIQDSDDEDEEADGLKRKSLEKALEKAPLVFERSVKDVELREKSRLQYLSKLSMQKVWIPQVERSPKHQTAIIFDWDDTLLCTTFLSRLKHNSISPEVKSNLQNIERAVLYLLNTALTLGHTFIVTNAKDGWVQESAALFLPGLMETLQRVRVVSARSTQQTWRCHDPSQWKVRAFLELGQEFDSQKLTNVVSIGDSQFELEAANTLTKTFAQGLLKVVKLQETPTSKELMKELDILVTKFKPIVEKAENYKFRFERK